VCPEEAGSAAAACGAVACGVLAALLGAAPRPYAVAAPKNVSGGGLVAADGLDWIGSKMDKKTAC
jgi:hypothetical protein